jgi:hypothetical protein
VWGNQQSGEERRGQDPLPRTIRRVVHGRPRDRDRNTQRPADFPAVVSPNPVIHIHTPQITSRTKSNEKSSRESREVLALVVEAPLSRSPACTRAKFRFPVCGNQTVTPACSLVDRDQRDHDIVYAVLWIVTRFAPVRRTARGTRVRPIMYVVSGVLLVFVALECSYCCGWVLIKTGPTISVCEPGVRPPFENDE